MTESELASLIEQIISEGTSDTQFSSSNGQKRDKALAYFNGDTALGGDLPVDVGGSSVVSRDLADAIGWILPGLNRVFLNSEIIWQYEPQNPNDMQSAKQATDYVNYKVARECNADKVIYDAMMDSLLLGNGIVKVYWSSKPEYTFHRFTGLDENSYVSLVNEPDVEIVDQEAYFDQASNTPLIDLKLRRTTRRGRLMLACVPDEDFIIDANATALDEECCRFAAQRLVYTRTQLIEMGFDKKAVNDLPPIRDNYTQTLRDAGVNNENNVSSTTDVFTSAPSERVEVFECYIYVDFDGDGLAEWRQVFVGGVGASDSKGTSSRILWNEEYDGLAFVDLVHDPIPHTWRGRSMFDQMAEIQKLKTAAMRYAMNNFYHVVVPDRAINLDRVKNPDSAYDRAPGNTIITDGDPGAIIQYFSTPYVGDKALMILEYLDKMAEKRTGLSENGKGLDPEELQNQTATAVQAQQSALYLKAEDYARNISRGLRRIGKKLLALLVENQDRPDIVRLRDKFIPIDPRSWNSQMNCDVNTGLGSGSRERDAQALLPIVQMGNAAIAQFGPANPLFPLDKYSVAIQELIKAAGLRDPERYASIVDPNMLPQLQQAFAQMQEAQSGKNDNSQAEMAKLQIAAQKTQAEAQLAQQKAQAESAVMAKQLELKQQEAEFTARLDIERMNREHALEIERMQREHALKVAEMQADYTLKQAEMEQEAELAEEKMRHGQAMDAADLNIRAQQVTAE